MRKVNIGRRGFMQGTVAFAGASLYSSSALSSIDPNSNSDRVFHASHYGTFEAVVRKGKFVGLSSMVDLDAQPTEMLSFGILDRTYDKTRVMYPAVRKSYLENWDKDDRKVHLRGKEPFVRVDWDTAYMLTAKAIVDTIEKHGNEGVFSTSYGGWSHAGMMRPNVLQGRLFNLLGGSTITVGDWSAGASQVSLPYIIGNSEVYSTQSSWETIRDNTEVFVLVGCDPVKNCRVEYRVADHGMYNRWKEILDSGTKFVSINPQKTASDTYLDAEWVKIIPNTDVALFLAMSQFIVSIDRQDKNYLKTYTVGSDKFFDYIMGKTDGVAKTPDWASKITGISPQKIRELAVLFASQKTQFGGAWSLQRAHHGEMTHWAIVNFAALTGKIGKPGQGVGFSWHYGNGGMPPSGNSMPAGLSQGRNLTAFFCPASRITDMLENPGKELSYNGNKVTYPSIKMIYNAGNNFMSHQQDTNALIRALGNIDTVVSQDPWWCASNWWADIVLAANTTLERNDLTSGGTYSNNRVYAMKKVIDSVGDSRSDFQIFGDIGDYLGVGGAFREDAELTYEDLLKKAYGVSSAEESFEDFWKKGYVELSTPNSARQFVRHGSFFEDPDRNPLHTASGKIEMYCKAIADQNIEDCPGMPMWMEPAEYLGNAKEGELHVVSPHPWYRLHSQMGNSERLRELYTVQGREPVRINTEDAKARGIADGDLVEIYNDRGTVIAGAVVSDEIMSGVISIYEGCWPSVDSKGRCNSGLVNFITSNRPSSGLSNATTANTLLAKVRKCTDAEPYRGYTPPKILKSVKYKKVEEDDLGLDRIDDLIAGLYADMEPGERLFFERCTVCHGPREPSHYTQLQWKGHLESMFPRAGLEPSEEKLVSDYLMRAAKDGG